MSATALCPFVKLSNETQPTGWLGWSEHLPNAKLLFQSGAIICLYIFNQDEINKTAMALALIRGRIRAISAKKEVQTL